MVAQLALPWSELMELHVVRNVAKLLARRWSLGLGMVDAISTTPPLNHRFAEPGRLCPLIQSQPAGLAACTQSTEQLFEYMRRRVGAATTACAECHAGLFEMAAPITVAGELRGALVCGGFSREEPTRTLAGWSGRSIDLADDEISSARKRQVVLAKSEESFVAELLKGAAEEISAFLLERSTERSKQLGEQRDSFDSIIGSSPAMQHLYSLLDRVSATDSTVLVQGENGTGKELVARAIHRHSLRKDARFVVQNCSAFNDNLLDSELFGHKRGAFTGAVSDKQGLFEVADQGTFFLDEIGDMSPALQVKVLRVLQEGTFTPVGDTTEKKVDVRIIAATNRDLKAMVASGEFREDLYYRINVINLVIPPLRERQDDIAVLAEAFLAKQGQQRGAHKALTPGAVRQLQSYPWPGNVRELENEIERAVVLSGDRELIDSEDLSPRIGDVKPTTETTQDLESLSLPAALKTLERRMILTALRRNQWNKTRAAADLEISRRNLIRLVQKYDLEALRHTAP